MKPVKLTPAMRKYLIASLFAAGLSAPTVFVSTYLTEPSEGTVLGVYADPVGLPTSCIGHLDKKAIIGTTKTFEQCVSQFVNDVAVTKKMMNMYVKVSYRSEWQEAALIDFTINKGIGNFSTSTLLKKLNKGDHDGSCEELTRWVYATYNGKKVKLAGLEIRASKQYQYCMGTIPKDIKAEYDKFMKEYGGETKVEEVVKDS